MGDMCHHCKGDTWHRMMSTGDWAGTVADTWTIRNLTRGRLILVVEVPRGPFMGCHVAPCGWLVVYVKFYGFTMGRTPDLSSGQWTGRTGLTACSNGSSYKIYVKQCI
jgi:hypothetical protein